MEFLIRAQAQMVVEGGEVGFEVGDRVAFGVCVVNTETAANVDKAEFDTFLFIFVLQAVDGLSEHHKGFCLSDLRSDVEMQTFEVDGG